MSLFNFPQSLQHIILIEIVPFFLLISFINTENICQVNFCPLLNLTSVANGPFC